MAPIVPFGAEQGKLREKAGIVREKLEKEIIASGQFACKVTGIVLLVSVIAGPLVQMMLIPFNAAGLTDFLVPVVFGAVYLVASLTVIRIFIELAKGKGYFRNEGTGWLWFVGLCTTPITLGLLVLALPDSDGTVDAVVESDLPNF